MNFGYLFLLLLQRLLLLLLVPRWENTMAVKDGEVAGVGGNILFFHFFKACWLVLAAVGLLLPLLLPLHDFVAHSAGQTAGAAGGTAAAAAASVAVSAMAAVQQLAASQQLVALTAAAAAVAAAVPTKTRPCRTGKHHGPEGRTESKICASRGRNVP